jgi:hypothetical protein
MPVVLFPVAKSVGLPNEEVCANATPGSNRRRRTQIDWIGRCRPMTFIGLLASEMGQE